MSLVQLPRNLSRNNLRSIHTCTLSFYALVTLPCYLTIALTSHSFCAHAVTPSHDSLSPFLTQLSTNLSHNICSLTLHSSPNLSRNLYCSLSLTHTHTGRGRTWCMAVHKAMRPCLWSILAKYDRSDHRLVHTNCNEGQKGAEHPLR
jgi:hypothetical protein